MKILVPTAGAEAAREIAGYVVDIAVRLAADLDVLHILREDEENADPLQYAGVFIEAAEGTGLHVTPHLASGEVVDAIIATANKQNATLILMGASRGQLVEDWLSADVMGKCDVPVLVVPHCYRSKST